MPAQLWRIPASLLSSAVVSRLIFLAVDPTGVSAAGRGLWVGDVFLAQPASWGATLSCRMILSVPARPGGTRDPQGAG